MQGQHLPGAELGECTAVISAQICMASAWPSCHQSRHLSRSWSISSQPSSGVLRVHTKKGSVQKGQRSPVGKACLQNHRSGPRTLGSRRTWGPGSARESGPWVPEGEGQAGPAGGVSVLTLHQGRAPQRPSASWVWVGTFLVASAPHWTSWGGEGTLVQKWELEGSREAQDPTRQVQAREGEKERQFRAGVGERGGRGLNPMCAAEPGNL